MRILCIRPQKTCQNVTKRIEKMEAGMIQVLEVLKLFKTKRNFVRKNINTLGVKMKIHLG